MDADDEREIGRLEEGMWRSATRFDREWMRAALTPDFLELGRSGRTYDLAATLGAEAEPFTATLPLPGYRLSALAEDVVLAVYVSEVAAGGEVLRANRSSIWVRGTTGWRLRFHQGTPVA
ncbi:DUF4440 domain-containing protein [Amnibacterium sp. CER49]|uniref:nuclear transport factor 2 family protein n=1 Tax=Amnibacterium sp. CER49 TaxID=3039161 RepID=UPI00244B29E6|nr:DUF4440 domain-containing protein [Amnibacterium sp. CER49]MDH2444175.1 DUF4440 domain-containing protein [Amnibacterium sp. CER49]